MAKVTAPLLALGASGTIGKTMTFAKWRGIAYARQRVVPANPQSTLQTQIRATFALLREMWKLAPGRLSEVWNAFASGRPFTGMNKFVGENVRVLKYEADMQNFIGSPGAKGGLPPDGVVLASPGAGAITATFTVPAAPIGWAIVEAVSVAFIDQMPDGIFSGVITEAFDATAPYVPTFAGLDPGDYVVASWLKWEKPDGSFAYSVGLTGTQTVA